MFVKWQKRKETLHFSRIRSLPEGKIYDMNCKIETNYGAQIQSPNEKRFDQLRAVSKRKGIIEFWCILPGEKPS